MSDPAGTVTAEMLGQMFSLTERRINMLADEGVIPKAGRNQYLLVPVVQAYVKHLREKAGQGGASMAGLAQERTRLAREQADKTAMANAIARRELAPVGLLERVVADAGAKISGILEGIVPAVKRRLASPPPIVLRVLTEEIDRARLVASSIRFEDLPAAGATAEATDDTEEAVEAER